MQQTIRAFIDERAQQAPDAIFLIAPEAKLSLSYGQLKDDSETFGKYLMKLGLRKGCKASFMLGNGYQTAKLFLGAMYSGCVVAPLNLMAQPAQLEYVLDHSDTEVVFFSREHRDRLQAASTGVDRDILMLPIDNDSETIVPPDEDLSGLELPAVEAEDDALLTLGDICDPRPMRVPHRAAGMFDPLRMLPSLLTPLEFASAVLGRRDDGGDCAHFFAASSSLTPAPRWKCWTSTASQRSTGLWK